MEGYHQVTLNEWLQQKQELQRELNNVREGFIRVGFVLRWMDETKAYEAGGYKSVAEFAEKEHGLKPSTTSRWMSLNRQFSLGGYSRQIDPKYRDMNASQLTEMLGLPDADRELVTPETSREEIRELRRFNKAADKVTDGAEDLSPMQEAFADFLRKTPDAAERVAECMRSGNADDGHLSEAVAPSGSRMFRAGTRFITFQKTEIRVKTFGGGQETVSWEEFARAAEAWMEEQEDERSAEKAAAEEDDGRAAVEGAEETGREGAPEGIGAEVPGSRGVDDERRAEDGAEGTEGVTGEEDGEAVVGDRGNEGGCRQDAGEGLEDEREEGGDRRECAGEPEGREAKVQEAEAVERGEEAREAGEVQEIPDDLTEENDGPGIAPAQFTSGSPQENPGEVIRNLGEGINKPADIVDESGNPSPETEEERERERAARIEEAIEDIELTLLELQEDFRKKRWKAAEEEAEYLRDKFAYLREHDM